MNEWKQNITGNANEMFGFGMNPINLATFSLKYGICKKRGSEMCELKNVWYAYIIMLLMNMIHLERIQCSNVSMVIVHNSSLTHTWINYEVFEVWKMKCVKVLRVFGPQAFEFGFQWYNTRLYLHSVEMLQSSNVHAQCISNWFLGLFYVGKWN